MRITDIRIRPMNGAGRMKAIVSITIEDCFTVHDIKVIEGPERLFIAMPSRKSPDGVYKDIAHPITPEARAMLEAEILKRYHEVIAETEEQ